MKIILSAMTALILGLIAAFFIVLINTKTPEVKDSLEQPSVTTEKTQRSVSGESLEEDKKDALRAAQDVLEEAMVNPAGEMSALDRMEAIEKDDGTKVYSDRLASMIRSEGWDPVVKDVQTSRTIQYVVGIAETISADGAIAPLGDDSWDQIHLDQEAGYAFVPMKIFKDDAVFDFTMVYVDGEWKLISYPLLREVAVFSNIAEQQDSTR